MLEFRFSKGGTFLDALYLASVLHSGQRRIGGRPTISHCLGTMAILSEYGENNPDLLIAGVLHDTLEDTPLTFGALKLLYPVAAEFVAEVTKINDSSFPLQTREGRALKMADRLDNLYDLNGCNKNFVRKQITKSKELFLGRDMVLFEEANPKLFGALHKQIFVLEKRLDKNVVV